MSDIMILSLAVLSAALLFGGIALYAFGFAAFLFTALLAKTAGAALRRAFPWFYAFVIATSAAAALLWWPRDAVFAAVMAAVAVTTVPVRQIRLADFVFDKRQGQRASAKKHRRNRHYERQFIRNTLAHLPQADRAAAGEQDLALPQDRPSRKEDGS